MIKIKKILVPTDFSEESLKALRYAQEFCKTLMGAEILLVHVMEPPVYPTMNFVSASAVPSVYDELRKAAAERLDTLCKEYSCEAATVRPILRDGSPYVELVEVAREENVDLIIIATHGHTGIKRWLLGSVAERVLRTAPCPVLTVREKEREIIA